LLGSSLPEGVGIFPLGQRHLKDIDEPEVVYQLEIDGVEPSPEAEVEPVVPAAAGAPAPPEPPAPPSARNFDQRMEDWAESLQSRIEDQVASSLERSLNLLPPRKKR
jgi:hypothetical protein